MLHRLLLVLVLLLMFRRLRWFVGLNQKNWSTKRLVNVDHQPGPGTPNKLLPVLDAVHEVAIYIHRFHNLDLFEQGYAPLFDVLLFTFQFSFLILVFYSYCCYADGTKSRLPWDGRMVKAPIPGFRRGLFSMKVTCIPDLFKC